MKKVAIVSYYGMSNAGGVERVVYYLHKVLVQKGYEVSIIDIAGLTKNWIGKIIFSLLKLPVFKRFSPLIFPVYTSFYLWFCKRSYDCIISQGEIAPFFSADYVFMHGCYHAWEIGTGMKIKEAGLGKIAYLQKCGCTYAKKIIAVGEVVKTDTIRYYGIPADKISILNNCVDTDLFFPIGRQEERNKTILYIGRLEIGKGLKDLLEFAHNVEKTNGYLFLIVCNNAQNVSLFNGLTKTTIKIGLNVNEINLSAYGNADIVYFPSLFEGFEMITLESLAAGVPILGNAVGAIYELSKRSFPGVYLINKNVPILEQVDDIIDTYYSLSRKQELHVRVKNEFGIKAYGEKLNKLLQL